MATAQAGDARKFHRFLGTIGPLRVRPDSLGTFSVKVRDFSIVGAGILADRPFSPGTSLAIESGRTGKPPTPLLAEIRHATKLQDGNWLIGCHFSRVLSLNDLCKL